MYFKFLDQYVHAIQAVQSKLTYRNRVVRTRLRKTVKVTEQIVSERELTVNWAFLDTLLHTQYMQRSNLGYLTGRYVSEGELD